VGVVAEAEAEPGRLEAGEGPGQLGAQVGAALPHINQDRLAHRHTVDGVVFADGDPEAAGLAEAGAAHRDAPGRDGAVDQRALVGRVGGVGEAGDAEVFGLGAEAVDLEREGGAAGGGREDAGALMRGGSVAEFRAAAERMRGGGRGDAVVNHVDHAADGGAAIEQRGGAAQNLDALDEQRLDTDVVIGADIGGIERADAVVEHPHAVAAEPRMIGRLAPGP
jgi:hypothetical protein